jgi:hypothetical protein
MRVNELIDILRDQPPEAEVELAVVAPVDDEAEDITVDRYVIEGVLPWVDADEEEDDDDAADDGAEDDPEGDSGAITIWLVGGENEDVDAFLDAIEQSVEDEAEHEH